MDLGRYVEVARASRAVLALAALMQNFFAPVAQAAKPSDSNTITPIKHELSSSGKIARSTISSPRTSQLPANP